MLQRLITDLHKKRFDPECLEIDWDCFVKSINDAFNKLVSELPCYECPYCLELGELISGCVCHGYGWLTEAVYEECLVDGTPIGIGKTEESS